MPIPKMRPLMLFYVTQEVEELPLHLAFPVRHVLYYDLRALLCAMRSSNGFDKIAFGVCYKGQNGLAP